MPEESIDAYKKDKTWKEHFKEILPLSETSDISVVLPTDVQEGYYENMTVELHNLSDKSVQNRLVLNKRKIMFDNQMKENEYQALLKNAYGQVMGQTDTVELGEENLTLTIDNLLQSKDVSLKVTIPDGTDVTDKVSVLWREADREIGYASLLKAVAEGTELTCKVALRSDLAIQYAAPDAIQHTVDGEGENLLTLQLQPMQQLAMHGLVKDKQTGEPISDATVALTQQLGGDYNQSVTAKTGDNGQYELQGTNMQGELSVTAPGYLPKTMEFGAPASNGTLPAIELEQFNGVIVSAWLTYTASAPEGIESTVTEGYNGNGDVAYQVYNQTKGAAVENFIIKDNLLYFPSDVEIGDELRVTASSHNNNFNAVSATCEITNSGTGYVTLPLVQRGSLKAIASSTAGNSVMGVLYDADGRFVRSNIYRSTGLSFAGLASGDYTLVSMTSNTLLRRVLLMSTLSDMGLKESTDYVKNAVHIEDGKIVTVNVQNVPALDMEKLRFTDSGTYFIVDKNIIKIGQNNTVSARVNFAEQYAGRIGNVEYMVDMPEGTDLAGDIALIGSSPCNYRIEDGHYIFPIENMGNDQLKFSIRIMMQGEFHISGSVRFTLDGVKMVQPIGAAWVQANGFTMNTPVFLSSSTLYVRGTAPMLAHGKMVKIYDYDKLIGSANVGMDGMWLINIQIPSNGLNAVHAIKAQLTISETSVIESDVKYVAFNSSKKIARRVVMLDQKKKPITFNYVTNSVSPSSYTYVLKRWWNENYPYSTKFTFLAYFDGTDVSKTDTVKIAILASDGTTRTLVATYDATQQCYYASSNYPPYSSKKPVSAYAYLEGTYSSMSEEELSALAEEKEKAVAKVTQIAVSAAEKKGETEVLSGDEETLNLKYTVNGKEPLAFTMKEMDYDEASAYVLENGPLIYRGEAGNIVYTLVNGIDEMELILIDMDEHLALRTLITYAEIDNLGVGSRRRQVGPKKISAAGFFGGAASLGSDMLSLLGLQDYLNAPGQYAEMDNRRDALQKLMKRNVDNIEKLLARTCPDGTPRYSSEQLDYYDNRLNNLINKCNSLINQLNEARDDYTFDLCRKALWDVGTTALGGGLTKGLVQGAATKLGPKALAALEKASALLETETGELTAATLGFAKDMVTSGKLGDIPSLDQLLSLDFNRHYQDFQNQLNGNEKIITKEFGNLAQEVSENAEECEEDECEEEDCDDDDDDDDDIDDDDDDDDDDNFPEPTKPLVDPSGYIYEAVLSNRIEGATAVLYYNSENQDAMWDAENYRQVNPQITGADGMYQWDVPEGLWQVRVQKEGWQNNNSDWLPVPPPQLDVNIPLVRNKMPKVEKAHAYEDAVTVKFDSYMLPDSLTAKHITVTENGNAVEGTITLTDEEAAPDGVTYASQLRFVPKKAFTANEVTLYVSGQVVNYAGIEMDEPFEAVLPVEKEVKGLAADKKVKVEYQSTGVIRVKGTPAAAAAGKTVTVKCMSGIITSVAQTSVVLDANGEAEVTVQGDLLGKDYVTFTLEDPELTASTTVKVVTEIKLMVEAPEASVATETEVEKGTEVTLTCSTEGAVIYYTLDGSNPASSDTRILYDAPIVINTETTITAVTILEGKGVSEVKSWHYTVIDDTGLTELSGTDMRVTPARVRDSFVVTGVEGVFSLRVYSMSGKLLLTLEQVRSGQRVDASALPAGIHLVVVNTPAASFTQRIIKY